MAHDDAELGGARRAGFVGRRAELVVLGDVLDQALDGRPSVVLIEGEVGIGKSRLARELLGQARGSGAAVLAGRCYEGVGTPYLAFLDGVLPALVDTTRRLSQLQHVDGLLERFRGAVPHAGGGAAIEMSTLVPEIVSAFIETARYRPLVILIEDLHWADPASAQLFLQLAYSLSDRSADYPVPALLMATLRSDPDNAVLADISRLDQEDITLRLTLEGLAEDEVALLLRDSAAAGSLDALVDLTSGNPLFLEAVVAALGDEASQGRLTPEMLRDLPLPADTEAAVKARLDPLSENCREVLTLAAFLGTRCSFTVLVDVARSDEAMVLAAIEEAIDRGVLVELADDEIAFTHPLYRRAAYRSTSRLRATRLHGEIARALIVRAEDGRRDLLPAIAHHLRHSGAATDRVELVRWTREAAEWSFGVGDWAQAAELYGQLLETDEGLREDPELLLRHGIAAHRSGNADDGIELLLQAADTFLARDDAAGRARALIERQRVLLGDGRIGTDTSGPLAEALEGLEAVEPALACEALADLAYANWMAGRYERASEHASDARARAERLGENVSISRAAVVQAVISLTNLQLAPTLEAFEAATSAAERTGTLPPQHDALSRYGLALFLAGRLDDAHQKSHRSLQLADEIGIGRTADEFALATSVMVAVVRGDQESAEALAYEAGLGARRQHHSWSHGWVRTSIAAGRAIRGDLEGALDALEPLVRLSHEGLEAGSPIDRAFRAWVHAEGGDVASARAIVDAGEMPVFDVGVQLTIPSVAAALVDLAWALQRPELTAGTAAILEEALSRGVRFTSNLALFVPCASAQLAALSGDEARAAAGFADAIALARSVGAPLALARAAIAAAEFAARGGGEAGLDPDLERVVERFGLTALLNRMAVLGGARVPLERYARGERAIALIDVTDSTRLGRELGDAAFLERKRHVERILLAAVARHGGRTVEGINLGDGILAVFDRAQPAVLASLEATERVRGVGLEVHAGVDQGDVIIEHQRVHGTTVNTAARLCDVAGPGQVAVGREVALSLSDDVAYASLGTFELKGLEGPREVFEVRGRQTSRVGAADDNGRGTTGS